jgi:hypothetical protein
VAGLQNVWICAVDLQLVRADRVVSLLVPIGAGYGASSPGDPGRAVYAELDGTTEGDAVSRVRLADCGTTPAGELLAGLAAALSAAGQLPSPDGCVFVFAERDAPGRVSWITAPQLPAAWPRSTAADDGPAALTRSPLA